MRRPAWCLVAALVLPALTLALFAAALGNGSQPAFGDRAAPVRDRLSLALVGSGLYGMVARGPTTPVCRVEVPCSAPAAGARLLFERQGHVFGRVIVSPKGLYSIRLRAGAYRVVVSPSPRIGAGIRPGRVRVSTGRRREIDFWIDSGIR